MINRLLAILGLLFGLSMGGLAPGEAIAPEWPLEKREFSEGHYGEYERFRDVCAKWGYSFKAYNVYTSDGWFLTVFRIVGM